MTPCEWCGWKVGHDRRCATERAFTLDGEPVSGGIAEFARDNELSTEERAEIAALEVGGSILYGGGAAAEFVLRREA